MSTNDPVNQVQQQIDATVAAPARSFASLMLDHVEQLASLQFEAAKAYADAGVQQARAALEIKDTDALQQYAEKQKAVAKDLGERVKADGEKVVALNQDFANEARKLVESSAQSASETATETVEAAKKATKAG